MYKRVGIGVLLILVCSGVAGYVLFMGRSVHAPEVTGSPLQPLPVNPRDVTIRVDETEYALLDGYAAVEVPNSSAKSEVRLLGEPVSGDMNGDGADDALLVLARTEGGSGTFYYLGLALAEEGGYLGMNAAYLGDRISLPEVSVRNELATVRFREHAQDQPYAEEPTQEALVHGVFTGAVLEVVREVDGYHEGILTYEDEAWHFDVCNQTRVAVAEDSPSRAALEAIYLRESGAEGKGVFMSILAETGMDAAWRVTRILSVPAQGACTETSPRAPDAVPPEVSTTTEAY